MRQLAKRSSKALYAILTVLLLGGVIAAAQVPPLPTPLTAAQIATLRARVQSPRSKVQSPKVAAFIGASVSMAIVAPAPLVTNVLAFNFGPARDQIGTLPDGQPLVFTFTNIAAFADVRTNFGPWFRARTATIPPGGGDLLVTNVNRFNQVIEFRSGITFNPINP